MIKLSTIIRNKVDYIKYLAASSLMFPCLVNAAFSGYLQLGVFKKYDNAKKMVAYLESKVTYPMALQRSVKNNKPLYTVIVQGFKNKSDAVLMQKDLKKKGYVSLLKKMQKKHDLFRMMPAPAVEEAIVSTAYQQLNEAIKNPEWLLNQDLHLPTAPDMKSKKAPIHLSIRDAILLSLRYSSDVQDAELNRITQRYQLRIEQNEFEFQYALEGSNQFNWAVQNGRTVPFAQSWELNPSISRKNTWGGTSTVTMNNSYDGTDYTPQVVLGYQQPLLRGAGPAVVEQDLNNQLDQEIVNKLSLKQTYIDTVTSVINSYRSLVEQENNYQIQEQSLKEAKYTLWVNKKRIEAGELERTGNIQQEYQVSNLSVTLEGQRNSLQQAQRSLLQLLGLDPELNITVPSDIELKNMDVPDLQKSIKFGLAHNTSYLSSLIQYRITRRALIYAQNQQLWQLNFSASKTYGTADATGGNAGFRNIFNGRNQSSQMGLTLNVPINDLDRRSTLISAKVSLEQARLKLLAQKRQLETNIINQVINIKTQMKLYMMSLKQLELAQRSYNIELKKQRAGFASAIDVTNTQNQLISARSGVISTKISYLNDVSGLEQLLGTTLDVWKIKMRIP